MVFSLSYVLILSVDIKFHFSGLLKNLFLKTIDFLFL